MALARRVKALLGLGLLLGHGALTETVLELAGHRLQMPHATSAGRAPSERLLGPVVCTIWAKEGSQTHQ